MMKYVYDEILNIVKYYVIRIFIWLNDDCDVINHIVLALFFVKINNFL